MWAIMTALVRGLRADASCVTSMLSVTGSTSTNTGTTPCWMAGATVVGKPAATVMTSSPGRMRRSPSRGEVSVEKATRLADEPELTSRHSETPTNSARPFSSCRQNRPLVSQKSSPESTRLTTSRSSNTRPA